MTMGQVPQRSGYFLTALKRWVGLAVTAAVLTGVAPSGLTAAIDRHEIEQVLPPLRQWTFAQSTTPPAEAVVPPVKRERPSDAPPVKTEPVPAKAPEAPAQPAAPQPASEAAPGVATEAPQPDVATTEPQGGILGMVQDWLARANREYQGVVVKQLSLPPSGATPPDEDPIAKKLSEQQDEEARTAAAAEAKRKAAEAKAADEAKAAMAKRLAEDRQRAEETKRLADEAKRKADEVLKAAEKPAAPEPKAAAPEPKVAAPTATPAAPDKAAELAEQQRREAAKLAEEVKRQDALRQQAEEQARRQEAERKRAEAARLEAARAEAARADAARAEQQRAAEARRAPPAAGADTEMHRRRIFVLTAEPIPRPIDEGTVFRPEMASRAAATADAVGSEDHRVRGTAVKRWAARASRHECRGAGRRITPPGRYTVKRGDSLWVISKRHYHKGRLYRKIYRANRARIHNPNLIYPCQRLYVPRRR